MMASRFQRTNDDYDRLQADPLRFLLTINAQEWVSRRGPFRAPLEDALVAPRPDELLTVWNPQRHAGEAVELNCAPGGIGSLEPPGTKVAPLVRPELGTDD